MAAKRKVYDEAVAPGEAGPRPALAAAEAVAVDSPVHAHLARLEASFSEADGPPRYPYAVRAAIMVGAPAALWGLVILSVGALAHAAGA